MSVDTAQAPPAIDVSGLRTRLAALIRAFGLMFSAVAFGTIQFFSHAMPSPDIVYVPTQVIFYAFGIGMVLPALVLLVIDRTIVANDASGVWVRRYRAGVFAVATVLVLRQLQLYFGPAGSFFGAAGPAQGLLFAVLAGGIVYAVFRWYEPFRQFYVTAAPLAVIFVLFTMMRMVQGYDLPPAYAAETPAGNADSPPVFIIIADEFSYEVLLEGDGIDAGLYPNLASLAGESAWFTNATSNHVHTTLVVPRFAEATTNVSDDYQLRVYSQYAYVESLLWDACGKAYTCRGAAYLSQSHETELVGSVLRRALFQATPSIIDRALGPVTGWMDDSLHTPAPNADPLAMHTFTTTGFESFMGDVSGDTAPGRVFLYHLLLPHEPMVFRADGSIRSHIHEGSSEGESWERYREQTAYFDSLIGRFTERLKSEGIYDDAVIIITGDHGRRPYKIQGRDYSEHVPEVPNIMPHVPLIIKSPSVQAGEYDIDYQHKDFELTFLDTMGRDVPAGEGVSAFAEDRPEREKTFYIDEYNERYWEYTYNEETQAWDFVQFVEGPLPGTTNESESD